MDGEHKRFVREVARYGLRRSGLRSDESLRISYIFGSDKRTIGALSTRRIEKKKRWKKEKKKEQNRKKMETIKTIEGNRARKENKKKKKEEYTERNRASEKLTADHADTNED